MLLLGGHAKHSPAGETPVLDLMGHAEDKSPNGIVPVQGIAGW